MYKLSLLFTKALSPISYQYLKPIKLKHSQGFHFTLEEEFLFWTLNHLQAKILIKSTIQIASFNVVGQRIMELPLHDSTISNWKCLNVSSWIYLRETRFKVIQAKPPTLKLLSLLCKAAALNSITKCSIWIRNLLMGTRPSPIGELICFWVLTV